MGIFMDGSQLLKDLLPQKLTAYHPENHPENRNPENHLNQTSMTLGADLG